MNLDDQWLEWDTTVYDAAGGGNIEELQAALATKPELIDTPNPKVRGFTPLHVAAENGHVLAVELLVRSGSKTIDTPDNDGCTLMLIAAQNGHVSVIEMLVRLGSKAIDTPDIYGHTPLNAAALNGHVSVVETLVRLGSNAIDTPNNGYTPLNAAAYNGHVSVIEALVRLGSKAINTLDKYDRTPMFAAAYNGHVSVIEALVRLGSNASLGTSRISCFGIHRKAKKTLKALGVEHEELTTPVSEDEALEIRYRAYFGHSLTHRLLFFLESADTAVVPPTRRVEQ